MKLLHSKLTYWDKNLVPYDDRYSTMPLKDFLSVQTDVENIIRTLIVQIYRVRTLIDMSDNLEKLMRKSLVFTRLDVSTVLDEDKRVPMKLIKDAHELISTVVSPDNALLVRSNNLSAPRLVNFQFMGARGDVNFIPVYTDTGTAMTPKAAALFKFNDKANKLTSDFVEFRENEKNRIKRLYADVNDASDYIYNNNDIRKKLSMNGTGGQVILEHDFSGKEIGSVLHRHEMDEEDFVFNEVLSGEGEDFPRRVLCSIAGFDFFDITLYHTMYYPEIQNTLIEVIPTIQGIFDNVQEHYEEISEYLASFDIFLHDGSLNKPKKLHEVQEYIAITRFLEYVAGKRIEEVHHEPDEYK